MRYDGGVEIDDNKRVMECPRCRNDEFSDDAEYCRICGLLLYNRCEGYYENNGYGNGDHIWHNAPGNARFCETCGSKTKYYIEGILEPWDQSDKIPEPQQLQTIADPTDDEDLPF